MTFKTLSTVQADHVISLAEQWSQDFYEDVMSDAGREIGDAWTNDTWFDVIIYAVALADEPAPDQLVERRRFHDVTVIPYEFAQSELPGGTWAVDTGMGRYIMEFNTEFGYEVIDIYVVVD